MRVGEIKNILEIVLNDNLQIQITSEPLYAGQAYKVSNYRQIIQALDILSEQVWNRSDYTSIESIKSTHSERNPQVLTVEEFNKLNTFVNQINANIPLYFMVLESLTEKQDEKTINIKLPPITSLNKLSEFNERIENVLKLFNVDGQFEFKGFDKGTEWYVVVTTGIFSYSSIIAGLKIAQEYFKFRTEYFKSEEARLSYEASLEEKSKPIDGGFESFQIKWLNLFIKRRVEEVIKELGKNGHTESELHTKLVKAVTKLVAELDEGTEFRLSLNPPAYVTEKGGELEIDYKKLKASIPQKEQELKTIEAPKNTTKS